MDIVQKAIDIARKAGVNVNDPEVLSIFLKDTLTGSRPASGWLYENGPFSLLENEPFSSAISGGSPLLNWIPSRLVDFRFPTVSHLEWVAPEGFTGSQTYGEYLRTITIEDCNYGPHGVWSGFEYQTNDADWSFTSPVLGIDDFGMRDFEKSPIYRVRGGTAGQPLTTDADWAVARALILMEQHLDYLVMYGDRNNSTMEYDGLDTIIQPGYVQSHLVGPGVPHWASPLVVNAGGETDPKVILDLIRSVVRRLRQRLIARKWNIQFGDMAIILPAGMWPYIADAHASGGNVGFANLGFAGNMDYRDFIAERSRITQGGLGFGFIDVDGTPVPVIPDSNMGNNAILNPGAEEVPGVAGDIMILTRRMNGITILEQQYVDWTQFDYPTNGTETTFPVIGGLLRAGWMLENNKCFQYYVEARGRLVSLFQPLQARINNVAIETLMEGENEGSAFWSPDFYAFDGVQGGSGGPALLTPV